MKKSIILAAGKGTRMESELPKVAHKVCGREMINHVLDMTKEVGIDEDIVIIGYKGDVVKSVIDRNVIFEEQTEQLGTAHATKMGIGHINDDDEVITLFGDVPLLKASTIKKMMEIHESNDADLTICTTILDDAGKYGRIKRDSNGNPVKIVEYKELDNDEDRNIKEINVGNMCFKGSALKKCLSLIDNNNAAGEYYIVDAVKICAENGMKVATMVMDSFEEGLGANTQEDLKHLEEIYKRMHE